VWLNCDTAAAASGRPQVTLPAPGGLQSDGGGISCRPGEIIVLF